MKLSSSDEDFGSFIRSKYSDTGVSKEKLQKGTKFSLLGKRLIVNFYNEKRREYCPNLEKTEEVKKWLDDRKHGTLGWSYLLFVKPPTGDWSLAILEITSLNQALTSVLTLGNPDVKEGRVFELLVNDIKHTVTKSKTSGSEYLNPNRLNFIEDKHYKIGGVNKDDLKSFKELLLQHQENITWWEEKEDNDKKE